MARGKQPSTVTDAHSPSFGSLSPAKKWPMVVTLVATLSIWISYLLTDHSKFVFRDKPPENIISGQQFVNREIDLDSDGYENCDFTNVTFKYNGIVAPHFSNNKIHGQVQISSDNKSISVALLVWYGLGIIDPHTVIHNNYGTIPNVSPPSRTP